MNEKSIFSLSVIASVSLLVFAMPSVFAEGGGGIECPEISGAYSYVNGTASYMIVPLDGGGDLGRLMCGYETGAGYFADINLMYHLSGEVNRDLIDEFGCGALLAEQLGTLYVSSSTYFIIVGYSNSALLEAANDILAQIEEQNFAALCTDDASAKEKLEEVKKETEEFKKILKEDEDKGVVSAVDLPQVSEEDLIDLEDLENFEDIQVLLPEWIKNNAGWWATGQISDEEFANGIEFLITEGFILLPPTEIDSETSDVIPDWVKNNAGWWAEGSISDDEFINGLQFLISKGIISVTFS